MVEIHEIKDCLPQKLENVDKNQLAAESERREYFSLQNSFVRKQLIQIEQTQNKQSMSNPSSKQQKREEDSMNSLSSQEQSHKMLQTQARNEYYPNQGQKIKSNQKKAVKQISFLNDYSETIDHVFLDKQGNLNTKKDALKSSGRLLEKRHYQQLKRAMSMERKMKILAEKREKEQQQQMALFFEYLQFVDKSEQRLKQKIDNTQKQPGISDLHNFTVNKGLKQELHPQEYSPISDPVFLEKVEKMHIRQDAIKTSDQCNKLLRVRSNGDMQIQKYGEKHGVQKFQIKLRQQREKFNILNRPNQVVETEKVWTQRKINTPTRRYPPDKKRLHPTQKLWESEDRYQDTNKVEGFKKQFRILKKDGQIDKKPEDQ